MGRVSCGIKNKYKLAMVNEPLDFLAIEVQLYLVMQNRLRLDAGSHNNK